MTYQCTGSWTTAIGGSLLGLALVAMGSMPAAAQEVYRTVAEDGSVSFSDVSSAGAQTLTLPSFAADEEALVRQRQVIEQQLLVAKALEESRLARVAARARRLDALAAMQAAAVRADQLREQEVERPRYVGGVLWRGHWSGTHGYWRGRHPGHPGARPPYPSHPVAPPPAGHPNRPPSQKVRFPWPAGGN